MKFGPRASLAAVGALCVLPLCSCRLGEKRQEPRVYDNGQWVARTVEVDNTTYPVSFWVPQGWKKPGPAVVFLHGMGECGVDGRRQLTVGLPPAIEDDPQRWPFVVICPQKPTAPSQWEDHAGAVFAALDWAVAEGLVDPKRVAITGLSQGGHGTIQIAAMEPSRFRAAAPVCGYIVRPGPQRHAGWSSADDPAVREVAGKLADMPVWIFHGGQDGVVPPGESRLLHDLLVSCRADVQLTIFEHDNHNSWDSAYRRTDLDRWLVEHTR
ncbi:MAG: prolyl oligopeptidase family serine peptidase [Phycisphaerales bacterium]|nr:prolyl oligopeptidase family serine peptidase [Phycisphaerales bacterium]